LSDSILSGGAASVAGAFAFTTPGTVPSPGIDSQGITFTPTDSGNYTAPTTSVDVGVRRAAPVLTRASNPTGTGFTVNWAAAPGSGNYTVIHSASKNMSSATEIFKRKNKKDTTVTLYFTHHGPVTKIDTKNNKAYAIRCAWLEPGGAPYMASLRIDQAKNWEEFRDACAYSHIPGENMIWADKKGNIGWQAVGITPIRTTHSGMVPIPGNGKYEWKGFLPIKERPHVLNPAKGFFATANQHVTPSDYKYPSTLAYTWADDYRGDRVNEVLSSTAKSTIESSMALQTDYTSLPARELVPLSLP
jgi:penicillin amidase